MKLPEISALDLVGKSIEEMFELPHPIFELVFEDDSIITTKQRTIWSWFLWEIHRVFPSTPLLSRHHIGPRNITPNVHIQILSTIKKDCKSAYELSGHYGNMVGIDATIHKCFNEMYNELTVRLESYVASADSVDVLNVLKHPVIANANNYIMTQPDLTAKEIDERHDTIENILRTDDSLTGNSVCVALRNDLVRAKQLLQCISARGFMSDVDNQNFSIPMRTSYSTGMRSLTNYACDSRMASVAAYAQQTTMRTFQYANRSLQILNGDVQNVHYEDCGTMSYTLVHTDSMKKLGEYIGMYHLDDNNKWIQIDTNDSNLLNRPIKLRTIVNCKVNDRHGVCIKCGGEVLTGIVAGDKIGQFVAAHVQEKQSQGALSVKHYSGNASDNIYVLADNTKGFFYLSLEDNNAIMVDSSFARNKGKIIFSASEVEFINNITENTELKDVTISRYSSITVALVTKEQNGVLCSEKIDLAAGSENGYLTPEAIIYLLDGNLTILEDGRWQMDLSNWDIRKPIVRLPRKKIDLVFEASKFDAFFKSGENKRGVGSHVTVTDFNNFGDALMAVQDITIAHSPTRVSHLAIMVYSLMANDPESNDYRLPDPGRREYGKLVSFRDKINYGNVAKSVAYERQNTTLTAPMFYTIAKRSPSDFEYFVLRGETMNRR